MPRSSLAERLKQAPTKTGKCAFYDWKMTLSPEDRAAVNAAIMDVAFPMPFLVEEFSKDGLNLKETRLYYHRAGKCKVCKES